MTKKAIVVDGKTKYVDLTPEEEAEYQERIDLHNSPEEVEGRRLDAIYEARNPERGSWREQFEYLIDNGYDALKARDDAIKAKHPKEKI